MSIMTQEKIANPLNFYKNPDEVAHDDTLSLDDKIKILLNWLNDIYLRQIAEEENMTAPKDSGYPITEIETLLRQYQKQKYRAKKIKTSSKAH